MCLFVGNKHSFSKAVQIASPQPLAAQPQDTAQPLSPFEMMLEMPPPWLQSKKALLRAKTCPSQCTHLSFSYFLILYLNLLYLLNPNSAVFSLH